MAQRAESAISARLIDPLPVVSLLNVDAVVPIGTADVELWLMPVLVLHLYLEVCAKSPGVRNAAVRLDISLRSDPQSGIGKIVFKTLVPSFYK